MKKLFGAVLLSMLAFCVTACALCELSAEDAAQALFQAGFDLTSITKLDADTDPAGMLGLPGQYSSKVSFDGGYLCAFDSEEDCASAASRVRDAAVLTGISPGILCRGTLLCVLSDGRDTDSLDAAMDALASGEELSAASAPASDVKMVCVTV